MICDNCIHNAVCERAHFDNHCGYKHTEADIINPELEKIKAEITACTQQEEGEVPACINYGIKLSTEIVEKHISELKGENNESI